MALAQVFLAQVLDLGHNRTTLFTCGQIVPAPLAYYYQPQQLKQARDHRQQINGVEHSFDQDLGHDHSHDDAGGFADPAHLTPIHFIQSGIHF